MKSILLFGPGMGHVGQVDANNPQRELVFVQAKQDDPVVKFEMATLANMRTSMHTETHIYKFDDVMSSSAEAEDVALYTHSDSCKCLHEDETVSGTREQPHYERAVPNKPVRDERLGPPRPRLGMPGDIYGW